MRRMISLLITLVLLCGWTTSWNGVYFGGGRVGNVDEESTFLWISNMTYSSSLTIRQNSSQAIKYDQTRNIYQVEIWVGAFLTNNIHLEIWSDRIKAGTQYGGDSDTKTLAQFESGYYTFTFSEPLPSPTGDFFVHFVIDSYDNNWVTRTGGPNNYEDTNYDYGRDGVDDNEDAVIKIWTR